MAPALPNWPSGTSQNDLIQQAITLRQAHIASVRNQILSYQQRYMFALEREYPNATPTRQAHINGTLNQIAVTGFPAAPNASDIGLTLFNTFGLGSGAVTLQSFGPTGTADDSSTFNNALAACANNGPPLIIPPGNYLIANQVFLPGNGLKVWAQPGALIQSNFTTTGDTGAITQHTLATSIGKVSWYGGTYGKTANNLFGRIFSLTCNGIFQDCIIDTTYGDPTDGGGGFFVATDTSLEISFCTSRNSYGLAGSGGNASLRLLGAGVSFLGQYNDWTATDQALQYSVAASSTRVNLTINKPQSYMCIGNSLSSQALACVMVGAGITSASINNSSYNWCVGASANRAILYNNANSPNPINGSTISNCYFDTAADPITRPTVVFQNEAGGTQNITTSLIGIMNADDKVITVSGATNVNTSGIDFTTGQA